MKKKLLFLSQCFPLPLDGGGKIKTFNTLETLAKNQEFEIFAIFVSERKASKKDLSFFRKLGIEIKIFPTEIMKENIKDNYPKLIWNYLQLRPHYVYQYRHRPSFLWIKNKIKVWQPDIIHVDHINSSQFLPKKNWLTRNCKKIPKLILENHNLDHQLFFSRLGESNKKIRQFYLFLEGSLNYLYGLINYKRYDTIFSISEEETTYLKKYYPNVFTQELIYPLKKAKEQANKPYDILFIGSLEWPPNEIALTWFSKNILPKINQKNKATKLHIVGKNNPRLNFLKKNKNIIFHAYQKNINQFLAGAKIFVLPFKTGAGVRIKALTALQNGIPLVSTEFGVSGLKIKNKQEYLLANSPEQFAKKILKLLTDKQLREKMSHKQKEYFKKNHHVKNQKKMLKTYVQQLKR